MPRPVTFTPTALPIRGPAGSGLRLARAKVPEGMLVWAIKEQMLRWDFVRGNTRVAGSERDRGKVERA